VVKPHPKKNWVNPDAKQVHFASGESGRRSGPTRDPGSRPSRNRASRSLVQVFAGLVGLVFLLIGIAGFIPGLTSHQGDLTTYGTDSKAELLGLFQVSVLHNVIHLAFGIGLLAATRVPWAKFYLVVGGVVYLGVAAYGFVVDQSADLNVVPFNDADNVLHVGLALGMILLGLVGVALDRPR
jgi:hypothetical protein